MGCSDLVETVLHVEEFIHLICLRIVRYKLNAPLLHLFVAVLRRSVLIKVSPPDAVARLRRPFLFLDSSSFPLPPWPAADDSYRRLARTYTLYRRCVLLCVSLLATSAFPEVLCHSFGWLLLLIQVPLQVVDDTVAQLA